MSHAASWDIVHHLGPATQGLPFWTRAQVRGLVCVPLHQFSQHAGAASPTVRADFLYLALADKPNSDIA